MKGYFGVRARVREVDYVVIGSGSAGAVIARTVHSWGSSSESVSRAGFRLGENLSPNSAGLARGNLVDLHCSQAESVPERIDSMNEM